MNLTRRQSLTGIAGILAAGVAPAAVVRSMIGARGVATSGGRKEDPIPLPTWRDNVRFTSGGVGGYYSATASLMTYPVVLEKGHTYTAWVANSKNSFAGNEYWGFGTTENASSVIVYGVLMPATVGTITFNFNRTDANKYLNILCAMTAKDNFWLRDDTTGKILVKAANASPN